MNMIDTTIIANNIRRLRKEELCETQEEFAEHIDASKDTISNIERCKVIPKIETLVKIADYTGKTLEYLLAAVVEEDCV